MTAGEDNVGNVVNGFPDLTSLELGNIGGISSVVRAEYYWTDLMACFNHTFQAMPTTANLTSLTICNLAFGIDETPSTLNQLFPALQNLYLEFNYYEPRENSVPNPHLALKSVIQHLFPQKAIHLNLKTVQIICLETEYYLFQINSGSELFSYFVSPVSFPRLERLLFFSPGKQSSALP